MGASLCNRMPVCQCAMPNRMGRRKLYYGNQPHWGRQRIISGSPYAVIANHISGKPTNNFTHEHRPDGGCYPFSCLRRGAGGQIEPLGVPIGMSDVVKVVS